ncbi:MAG: F0F1 ATP synthase subunit alpha [Clostridiales bacterium]|nr:F0F1 ATP synthase subunit alpha [Clostridiales bacterium]
MNYKDMNFQVLAYIRSEKEPGKEQTEKLLSYLTEKFGDKVSLEWKEDKTLGKGFKIEAGHVRYENGEAKWTLETVLDWSVASKAEQIKEDISKAIKNKSNVIPLIKKTIEEWIPKAIENEVGEVITVGDGIATVSGLNNATYGEILIFNGGVYGMVQDLKRDHVGCVLFGSEDDISEGSLVKRTGRCAGIPVSDNYLSRVVDSLGNPIDELGEIKADEYRPIETSAPGIIDRQPVNKPLETGILTIDSMFPIGRGQRELIIGDRQTGKTTIALDTIINQRGKDVICIYVAIGQKASTVAHVVDTLRKNDAMSYSVVISSTASDSAPLQYIAPYAGCALGEYFMHKGKDVLIIYDDLSKHAVAYRALSLLLERSPGREAYPGDVFYLHSRLLERSAHLSDELGGGSLSALPIVETQAGDVAAYIPTNIISITDGQIFLESELFFAGQRPAVNVGLSVSRVGGAAQTKAMKKAAGAIRLELAQYREMEVFTQFSSDLDEETKSSLQFGAGLMELLKQNRSTPYAHHEMVILLVCSLDHLMQDVPKKQIGGFARELLKFVSSTDGALVDRIDETGELTDEDRSTVLKLGRQFLNIYNSR